MVGVLTVYGTIGRNIWRTTGHRAWRANDNKADTLHNRDMPVMQPGDVSTYASDLLWSLVGVATVGLRWVQPVLMIGLEVGGGR